MFVRLYNSLDKVPVEVNRFEAYLSKIIKNTLIDALRISRRQLGWIQWSESRLEENETTRAVEPAWTTSSPADGQVVEAERARRLYEAIETLPPAARACVLLQVAQDLNAKEIAEVVHKPINTVKALLAQCRKRLREVLGDAAADLGLGRGRKEKRNGA